MTVVINGTTGVTTPGLSNTGATTNTGNQVNSGTVTNASTISVGNATPSASGAGITFPATQSASTNANTLDDYEEGTFSPQIYGDLVVGTPITGDGYYTKIGNVVQVQLRFENANKPSGGAAGGLVIGSLPFAIGASSTSFNRAAVGLVFTNGGTSITAPYVTLRDAGSQVEQRIQYQTNLNSNVSFLQISDLGAFGNYFRFSFTYLA